MPRGERKAVALVAVIMLLAVACGNSGDDDGVATTDPSTNGPPTTGADGPDRTEGDTDTFVALDEPGVTDDTIRIGGVVAETNPLGGNYEDAFAGTEAYFAMVNDRGGIYGRTLELTSRRDDSVAMNQAEVQALIARDDVFAVVPVATLLFTGAVDLVDAGIPTFGWNIQADWTEGENLFGEKGSFLCLTCPRPSWPWVARQLGRERVGILGYGQSDQSKECAAGWRNSFETFPTAEVVYYDDTLAYGVPDLSGEVRAMRDADVDLILTCMDQNGVVTLAREANRQQLDAIQFLNNAYDDRFVADFGELFEGSVVAIQFWPFEETTDQPQGMLDYLEWMETTGGPVNEISVAGWMAADLFVTGLREAGPEFSRQKVIDGINALTHWDAEGLNTGYDWTIAHTSEQPDGCFAMLTIESGAFVPSFGAPGQPFACIPPTVDEVPDEPELRP
jgi:branched-chain amino acid transport system substrate-binding protein